MFAKAAQFISNNIGFHFYKLTGDDIALVYGGIIILMFMTSIGSSQEYTLSLAGLFALSLIVYILSTIYGINSPNGQFQLHGGHDSIQYARNNWRVKLGDSLLVILTLVMQSVDMNTREDAGLAPFRLATLSAIYMFTLTGIRKNCLILVWFISMIFRLTIVQTASPGSDAQNSEYTGSFASSLYLTPFMSLITSIHTLALGLLIYEMIYLAGTEIVRLRLRPRVILQDIPTITKIEHSVFSLFYHQYSLLPPITLSQYDHVLLLLHISKHQVLSRLHVRQKRMFSKMQAELIRQTIVPTMHAPFDDSNGPTAAGGKAGASGLGTGAGDSPDEMNRQPIPDDVLEERIRNLRMRERVWSMGLKFDPSKIMFRGKMQSSENLSKAVNEEEALWPWHSKEAIICEASLPARYQDFKTSKLGPYTDAKLERWFLTWSVVSIIRLLTAAQTMLIAFLLLTFLSCLGAFNDILPSLIMNGFRTRLCLILYVIRIGSFLLAVGLFLPSVLYTPHKRQLEWVDLAEKQILKYRAFGIYLLLNGCLDWIVVAEQFGDSISHNYFLERSATFLQHLIFLPFLLAVPPHILAGCLLVFGVILCVLTIYWPVPLWHSLNDFSLFFGGCAVCVLFLSVPYYKVLRALFATYAAPYLLYLEALRPKEAPGSGPKETTVGFKEARRRGSKEGMSDTMGRARSSTMPVLPPIHIEKASENISQGAASSSGTLGATADQQNSKAPEEPVRQPSILPSRRSEEE